MKGRIGFSQSVVKSSDLNYNKLKAPRKHNLIEYTAAERYRNKIDS